LLDTGFIKEVYHPDWLINLVLVLKKNKEWMMSVDYTDLNKACKKISSGFPKSIKLWTSQPVAAF
jgi:hypothetical protein